MPYREERFWNPEIRDDATFERQVDYIRFDLVKHGLSRAALRMALH
jgi:hypothetical protein